MIVWIFFSLKLYNCMNFLTPSNKIEVQKIQDLYQNFIIMIIICSLYHFDLVMYYNFY